MHGADNEFSIGESQLIKHKAAPSVKGFADDHSRFNFKTVIIHNFSREKSVIACMTRLVLAVNCRSRHTVFYQYIGEKLTIGFVVTAVYFCL